MRNFKSTVLGFVACIATSSAALSETVNTNAVNIQPCSFWRYDYNTNMYGCTNVSSPVTLAEAQDVNALRQMVQGMKAKIDELEKRVKVLEGTP